MTNVSDQVIDRVMHGNADVFLKIRNKLNLKKLSELSLAEPLRGIYFLTTGDRCVYVGQTDNLIARLATHQREKAGEFSNVLFLEAPEGNMDAAELDLIRYLTPRLNKAGNPLACVHDVFSFNL